MILRASRYHPRDANTNVGASAYFRTTLGNAAVFAIKALNSPYALHVGLQSKASAQTMRTIGSALARAALEKLK